MNRRAFLKISSALVGGMALGTSCGGAEDAPGPTGWSGKGEIGPTSPELQKPQIDLPPANRRRMERRGAAKIVLNIPGQPAALKNASLDGIAFHCQGRVPGELINAQLLLPDGSFIAADLMIVHVQPSGWAGARLLSVDQNLLAGAIGTYGDIIV